MSVMQHINRIKSKIYDLLSRGRKKAFDKIHSLFKIKNSQQTQNKRKIPLSVKDSSQKYTAEIILNYESANVLQLEQELGKEVCLHHSEQHSTGTPSQCSKATKTEIKRHNSWKGESEIIFICRRHNSAINATRTSNVHLARSGYMVNMQK